MQPRERARQTDARGHCLICEEPKDERQRGLCIAHYEQFRRAKEKLPLDKRAEFEMRLIDAGQLMPDKRETRNPFKDLAEAMLAEQIIEKQIESGIEKLEGTSKPDGSSATEQGKRKPKSKK